DELADIDLGDPELHRAASKIQATFRRRITPTDDKPTNRTAEQIKQDEQDIADIDLKDPDLQKAASKIQATFRKKIKPAAAAPPQGKPE
ncbi:hypothetical protein L9F63_003963, partial [Diploptera punctata]